MKNKFYKKGFTLVETLVAIGVLILAVTGAFTAAQSGLSSYNFSKNQTIAFNLAQEAIEQIRMYRDENKINNRNWLTGLALNSGDPCYFGNKCIIDVINYTVNACGATCPALNQDTASGYYSYTSGWPASNFKREIQFTSISPTEISIQVTVTWSKGLLTRQIKVKENLYDW